MAGVRKYLDKDKMNLRKICLETSSFPTESDFDRNFLYLLYNDYYSECEKGNCFVYTDDNDEAVGYILCAEDYDSYEYMMKKLYLPKISYLGRKYRSMADGEMLVHRLFRKKYPAHLHIDILPEYQGKGAGTQLIGALKDSLREKGCKGIMLSTGIKNKKAISFYKKNGFKVISHIFGSVIMAFEL